jgi:hypothetical protein
VEDPAFTPHGVRDDEIGSRALMGTRKFRRAGCQVEASSEIPPPLTRQ